VRHALSDLPEVLHMTVGSQGELDGPAFRQDLSGAGWTGSGGSPIGVKAMEPTEISPLTKA
jgi:hypothetical protein